MSKQVQQVETVYVSEELEAENKNHASPECGSNNVETPIAAENEESARPDTCGFDVGSLWNRNRSFDSSVRELAVRNGRIPPYAKLLPRDSTRRPFPTAILQKEMQNGEFQSQPGGKSFLNAQVHHFTQHRQLVSLQE